VVVSGLAVIVSMAGLYVAQDATFSSMATATIVVVAVAVLGSLTVRRPCWPSSDTGSTGLVCRCFGG